MCKVENGGESYTTAEVAYKTGVSRRQLQWWDEKNLVRPSLGLISHQRRYSAEDLHRIAIIGQMRNGGLSLWQIRKALRLKERWERFEIISKPRVIGGVLFVSRRQS